jgi:4-diphosphocytidyl-2-C-methyl-D-erythritol kinase
VDATSLSLRSPAKINLGLRVVARRPDGYHDIESALQMVALADDIVLTRQEGRITCDVADADLPTDEDNLAVRAARALKAHAGVDRGVHIALRKRIPVGSGLGGGSSNAAAVLVGLQRLWGLDVSREALVELGASLGADVPFFLTSAAAWAEGKGDALTALPPLEGLGIVLVNPGFPVSTAWAYNEVTFGLTTAEKALSMLRFLLEMKRFTEIGPYLHNDFEPLIERSYPEVGIIRAALIEGGALGVALSGSGPTVFGLYPDAVPADVTSGLARPGWTVVATEPITDWEKMFVVPLETAGDGETCSPGRSSGG